MGNLQRLRSPNFGVRMTGHPGGRSCRNQLPLPVGLDGAVGRYRHHAGSRWRLRHWCSDVQCRVCWKIKWQGPWKEIQNTSKTQDPDVSGVFTALPVFFGWFCYQWYYDAWMKSAGSFKPFLLPWTPFDDRSHVMFLDIWQHLTTCNLIFKT